MVNPSALLILAYTLYHNVFGRPPFPNYIYVIMGATSLDLVAYTKSTILINFDLDTETYHGIFGPGKYFVWGGRKFCNFLSGAAINCPLENKASLRKTVLSFP